MIKTFKYCIFEVGSRVKNKTAFSTPSSWK